MFKALRFCYGTAFIFKSSLQTASKTVPSSKTAPFYSKNEGKGAVLEKNKGVAVYSLRYRP